MARLSVSGARALARLCALCLALACAAASAQTHIDKSGSIIPGVAPIYAYKSAGASQFISAGTLASATGLTPPAGATLAQICVEAAGVRYRDDGTAPTASVGIPVAASGTATICFQYSGPLAAIQFIAISGSPTMDVSYYVAN